LDEFLLQNIENELINATIKKGHPFKYFTLATLSEQNPRQRTVVLRKVQRGLQMFFYTDNRSAKVKQIGENPRISALFYDPKKMVQLQIQGRAYISKNPEMLQKIWKSIPENARRDYTTARPPGDKTLDPEALEYLGEQNHFCMVEITPERVEYLKLGRPHHLRIEFLKSGETWRKTFLVP